MSVTSPTFAGISLSKYAVSEVTPIIAEPVTPLTKVDNPETSTLFLSESVWFCGVYTLIVFWSSRVITELL